MRWRAELYLRFIIVSSVLFGQVGRWVGRGWWGLITFNILERVSSIEPFIHVSIHMNNFVAWFHMISNDVDSYWTAGHTFFYSLFCTPDQRSHLRPKYYLILWFLAASDIEILLSRAKMLSAYWAWGPRLASKVPVVWKVKAMLYNVYDYLPMLALDLVSSFQLAIGKPESALYILIISHRGTSNCLPTFPQIALQSYFKSNLMRSLYRGMSSAGLKTI